VPVDDAKRRVTLATFDPVKVPIDELRGSSGFGQGVVRLLDAAPARDAEVVLEVIVESSRRSAGFGGLELVDHDGDHLDALEEAPRGRAGAAQTPAAGPVRMGLA
jgi:hypothetical protein